MVHLHDPSIFFSQQLHCSRQTLKQNYHNNSQVISNQATITSYTVCMDIFITDSGTTKEINKNVMKMLENKMI